MVDYQAVSKVVASKYRTQTVTSLLDGAKMPSEIAEQSDSDMAQISRAITELREQGITELLVDEETKKGRLYGLTESGEKVAEAVQARQ